VTSRSNHAAHLEWFRNASPYINLHRGRTFVVSFGGEALLETQFPSLIHDIALLRSLGVRLVLVHGVRPQIDARLRAQGVSAQFERGMRITDAAALGCVTDAVGSVRVQIEGLLSHGLPNTPMSGARLRIASGNFVIAQPWGVRDGVDYHHTGAVRRIDAQSIQGLLDSGHLVLLSPLGYSATGELFNLLAEHVATEAAIALRADKLIFLHEGTPLRDARRRRISQLSPAGAEALLRGRRSLHTELRTLLECAVHACRHAVTRTHLVSRRDDGALLQELFTRDGAGTLISAEPLEVLRTATAEDIPGMLELLAPLEASGALVRRSREQLELEIANFCVIEKEGTIIGCAALYPYPEEGVGELACLAVHPQYAEGGHGARLLEHLQARAASQRLARLFVLTTRTAHWFREHGFEAGRLEELPVKRRDLYNYRRSSKVFFKELEGA